MPEVDRSRGYSGRSIPRYWGVQRLSELSRWIAIGSCAGSGGRCAFVWQFWGPQANMTDSLSPEARSALMARIRGQDTTPELTVRRLLHAMGYRFRLHRRDLAGRPDIVLPARRKVIFVHGCFWHGHAGCRLSRMPASRTDYWGPKLIRNRRRDVRNAAALRRDGWSVAIVWECQTRSSLLFNRD